ncbi:DUF397 domain-containing protein [Streptomyces sp. NPDC094049]|uniref:DUF397 domain-containing protein n=1 Tax=Streptomyces sp. NPDC094049 TaxID=3154987 RepID=UPI00332B63AC
MTPGIVGVFRKSSFSDQEGDCVEMAHTSTAGSAIRDSKAVTGPHLLFGADAWASFLGAVRTEQL